MQSSKTLIIRMFSELRENLSSLRKNQAEMKNNLQGISSIVEEA